MLAQSMTELEIAKKLEVNQSTISRDIKELKKLSKQFGYDLTKSDLAYCYKQCLLFATGPCLSLRYLC